MEDSTDPVDDLTDLLDGFREGDPIALARAISLVENGSQRSAELMAAVAVATGHPCARVGITGPPGAGKSSLVAALTGLLRERGERVGIFTVDPSSTRSGGALLGDRIRMGRHATDPDVFIRSAASRGARGGLTSSTAAVVSLMEAFGFSWVLVETVGAGQEEGNVGQVVDTVVVLFGPDSGDGVQAMKAGLRETADLLVVNKGDRPGADQVARELREALELSRREEGEWRPPVVVTTATTGEGVRELVDRLEEHRAYLKGAERA